METATKKLIEKVRNFLRHRSPEDVLVEKERLGNKEKREAVMSTSRSAINLWPLPLLRKTITSVYERWLWMYETEVPRSENNCYLGQAIDYGYNDLQCSADIEIQTL